MKNRLLVSSLCLSLCAAAAAGAANSPCTWDSDVDATVVEYWHIARPTENTTLVCSGDDCSLSGWIFDSKTKKSGNKPAIVFLHGSVGPDPTMPNVDNNYVCTLANYFIPRGYVIFMPYMRGYNDKSFFGHAAAGATGSHQKPGFQNTGEDYDTWANAQGSAGGHDKTYWTLYYMSHFEMLDIQNALTRLTQITIENSTVPFVNGTPLVNPSKIAIAGHSFGGARAVLTTNAHLKPLPKAVVDLSGAAMSWDTTDGGSWGGFMKDAATNREMPLYLHMNTLENPNGLLNPVIDTFNAADNAQGVGEAIAMIYSQFSIPDWFQADCAAVPIPNYWCAHAWFISSTVESARWLPHVEDFLSRHGL